jgi:hypothetical protein
MDIPFFLFVPGSSEARSYRIDQRPQARYPIPANQQGHIDFHFDLKEKENSRNEHPREQELNGYGMKDDSKAVWSACQIRHNIINKSPILTHDINLAIQDQWHCKMGAWHTLSSRLSKLILGDFISI